MSNINNMDMSHIFYKDLLVHDDNVFLANLAQNNAAEEILIKKDQDSCLLAFQ